MQSSKIRRIGYLVAVTACLVVLAVSVALFRREAPSLSYGSIDNIALHGRIHEGHMHAALSAYANKRLLLACNYGMSGIRALVNTPAYNREYAESCRKLVDEVLADNATDSFARVVRALADATLEDYDAMNQDLVYSRRTGKNELWIVKHRNTVAEANYQHLDDQTIEANNSDLVLLLMNNQAIRGFAQRYANDLGFRERIVKLVETLPEANQRRFIRLVRQAAQNAQTQ